MDALEQAVAKVLSRKKLTIAVAESCTGGLVSHRLTNVSGSSGYFTTGVIAYSNRSKENILGVSPKTIARHGAVSKEAVLEMAEGIRHLACADIGIGVTGIAGPTGGSKAKPVGLVYIAALGIGIRGSGIVKEFRFKGSREEIKFQASEAALELLKAGLKRRGRVSSQYNNVRF